MSTIFNFDIKTSLKEQEFDLLVNQFGTNVRQIKKYLKEVYPEFEYGYAEEYEGININKILRYTNNKKYMLYGDEAVYRLRYAIKAKAYIMSKLNDLDDLHKYVYECLYLYLRVNTLTIKYSFKSFVDDVLSNYNIFYKMNEKTSLEAKKTLLELTERCKSKRVQVKYHFTLEDFQYVNGIYDSWQEAYDQWINNYFDSLLDNYKKRELMKYKMSLQAEKLSGKYMSTELYNKLIEKKEKELDQIKIAKLSYSGFRGTVSKLLKANNLENSFIIKKPAEVFIQKKKNVQINYTAMLMADLEKYNRLHMVKEKPLEVVSTIKEDLPKQKENEVPKMTFEVPTLHTNIGMHMPTFSTKFAI